MSKSKKNVLSELKDSFLNENKIIFKKYKPIKEIVSVPLEKYIQQKEWKIKVSLL